MSIEKTQNLKRLNLPVGKLLANKLNPNKMNDAEFNLLYDNMEKIGFVDPVFVRAQDDGQYRIIGGHHRLEVAKLLGYEEVPCTVIDDPEFDEDQEKFQLVRMNVIRGKMTPQKFVDLYNSLSTKYADELMADSFGFADEEEFKKMVTTMAKGLPSPMQTHFTQAAKEVKTIDGLSKLLNEMFNNYGDTLPHGFMVVDFGGKESVWVKLSPSVKEHLLNVGAMAVSADRTMDDILGKLITEISKGSLNHLVEEAISNSKPVYANLI